MVGAWYRTSFETEASIPKRDNARRHKYGIRTLSSAQPVVNQQYLNSPVALSALNSRVVSNGVGITKSTNT